MYTSSYSTDLKLLLHANLGIMIVGGKGVCIELVTLRTEIEHIDFIFVRCKKGILVPKEYI